MISNCNTTEHFTDDNTPITSANISDYIYKVYKADVKAIQNLADIAIKLQAGGITVPGSMTIHNKLATTILDVSGETVLNTTLVVKGNSTIGGSLSTGATTITGSATITGDATITGNIKSPTIDELNKQIKALQDKLDIHKSAINEIGTFVINGGRAPHVS